MGGGMDKCTKQRMDWRLDICLYFCIYLWDGWMGGWMDACMPLFTRVLLEIRSSGTSVVVLIVSVYCLSVVLPPGASAVMKTVIIYTDQSSFVHC